MQLESEIRNISMGGLCVHAYCEKVKKIDDLLQGLGKPLKERNIILHSLIGLPHKYDSVANIIRFTKPFPSFSEMRSMLAMEETHLSNSDHYTESRQSLILSVLVTHRD